MKTTLYNKVYEQLKISILEGEFPLEKKLPSERDLITRFSVSAITLKKALDILKNEGYITRRPGVGTFVIKNISENKQSKPKNLLPIIGCVFTDFDDTFGTKILTSILENSCGKAHIILKKSHGDTIFEENSILELIDLNVDGIILLPANSKFISPVILELVANKFPIVVIDRVFDNIPVSCVYTDNTKAALIATQYLIDRKHKNIAIVLPESPISSIENRLNGLIYAHALLNITFDEKNILNTIKSIIPNSNTPIEEDEIKIKNFIKSRENITAIVAAEYNIALFVEKACFELGKRIPEDISIICFDYHKSFMPSPIYKFTHIEQQQGKMGEEAFHCLINQIDNPSKIQKIILEPTLVIGGSTK